MSDEAFFYLKGAVGVVAVLLLVAHMWQIRHKKMTSAQVHRYLNLFGWAVLITAASPEQAGEAVRGVLDVQSRNVAALVLSGHLALAMILSIWEERPKRKVRKNAPSEG